MNKKNEKIASLSFSSYQSLPLKGKPQPNEWTCLATIVMEIVDNSDNDDDDSNLIVICLGTGSKVQIASQVHSNGTSILDSHAEVICKRSFQRFLFDQIDLTISLSPNNNNSTHNNNNNNNNNSISIQSFKLRKCSIFNLNVDNGLFELKTNVLFHFFVSQPPCKI
jgi:tRNA-specific adenosine deaminase 1